MTDLTPEDLLTRASWPDRIYLQTGGIDMADYTDCEVTWCVDQIEDHDIGYVRDDLLRTAEAERDAAMFKRSEMRMCLNCGRYAGRDHNRALPLPGCPSPDACTFDLTPDEAWQHWRQQYFDMRAVRDAAIARAEDAESALDSAEMAHGITHNGNLWRFWREQARDALRKRDAAEAEVRMAALEEAARVAEVRWHQWNEYEPPAVECDVSACKEIADAIRAMKGGAE